MLNDLNALIGFEIELKIRGPTIYSQNLLFNNFILLQLFFFFFFFVNTKYF